uniref:Secreted protein n=1 Tax=Anopheles coluzzii TaxID=1518534 RepID=A0A8W7PBT5_ANOCL
LVGERRGPKTKPFCVCGCVFLWGCCFAEAAVYCSDDVCVRVCLASFFLDKQESHKPIGGEGSVPSAVQPGFVFVDHTRNGGGRVWSSRSILRRHSTEQQKKEKKASSFKNGTEPNEKRIVQQIASFIIIASEIVNHACVVVGTAKTHPLHSALRQTSHAAHHGQLAKSVRASVGHDVNEGNGGEPLTVLAILDGWQRWCGGPRPPIRFGRRWSRRHDGNS